MPLDITEVRRRLGDAYNIVYLPETSSTNDVAMQMAREGAPGGTLVCADFQTAGRGRRGAPWVAPVENCVLCSLLVRPVESLPMSHLAILTGVGAANGLKKLEIPVRIKWPNDLMVRDRKVAGILVETLPDAVVIGVGINCTVPEEAFPTELRERAGSLHALTGKELRCEDVLVAVAEELMSAVARVEAGGIIKVLYEWNMLNWLKRRKIRVSGPLGQVDGDGLFLDGRKLVFHVFKDAGVITMPLSSTVEAR
jgi:BirA family biotin operon repressor/biotin-[acetyl-CoA-carboxylase] ligase